MVLGTYTFVKQPGGMTFIQKDKPIAHVPTYSSVAVFSWTPTYAGKVIELSWNIMTTSQYDSLLTLYTNNAAVVFDPQDGETLTFNVEILSLDGQYLIHLNDTTGHNRINVKMQLLILSQV
jgi:hypothetical protein